MSLMQYLISLLFLGLCSGAAVKSNIKGCCVVIGCANPCGPVIIPPADTTVSGPAIEAEVTFEQPSVDCCGQPACTQMCGGNTITHVFIAQPVKPVTLQIVPGSSTDNCCGNSGCNQQCGQVVSVCQPVVKCGVLVGWMRSKCVTRGKRQCAAKQTKQKKSSSFNADSASVQQLKKINAALKLKIKQDAARLKKLQQSKHTRNSKLKKLADAKKIEDLKAQVKKATGKGKGVSAPVLVEFKKLAEKTRLPMKSKDKKKACKQMKGLVKVLAGHTKKKKPKCKKPAALQLIKLSKSLKAFCKQPGQKAIKSAKGKAGAAAKKASEKASIAAGLSEKKSAQAATKAGAVAAKLAGIESKAKANKKAGPKLNKAAKKLRDTTATFEKVFKSC